MSFAPSSSWGRAAFPSTTPRSRRTLEIVGVVFGFFYFWPAAVAYLVWKFAGYPIPRDWNRLVEAGIPNPFGAAGSFGGGTGNRAFDEYRRREIERLEAERRKIDDEAKAFREFVEELKRAKDREEFDAFMRRRAGA